MNSRRKQNTEKQSELAAKHGKQNELTPRQTEKIEAAKQTLKIYGAGYVCCALAIEACYEGEDQPGLILHGLFLAL